jgi:hypothetical protein
MKRLAGTPIANGHAPNIWKILLIKALIRVKALSLFHPHIHLQVDFHAYRGANRNSNGPAHGKAKLDEGFK